MEQFIDGEPQQRSIDRRHSLHGPAVGPAVDEVVDRHPVVANTGHDLGGVLKWRRWKIVEDLVRGAGLGVGLEDEFDRPLPGFATPGPRTLGPVIDRRGCHPPVIRD